MADLTIEQIKNDIEHSKHGDGYEYGLLKQLLATMQREAKLRKALTEITKVECPYVMFNLSTDALASCEYSDTKVNPK